MNFPSLLDRIGQLVREQPDIALQQTCELLHREVPHHNWVGFYIMNPQSRTLTLGPFAGAPTEHTVIPYGRGICGQVAESGRTFVVDDVSAESNYLSCSIATQAEVVIPIYRDGQLVAQLDIDSHTLQPFTPEEVAFLEAVCERIAPLFPLSRLA